MRRHPAAVALLASLVLASCKSTPERIVIPEIVTVPVREYVPVPDKLTSACPVAEVKARTVEAVVAAANARKVALEQCNRQLRAIRALGEVE